MVKVTILSEEVDSYFHTITVFLAYKRKWVDNCIHSMSYCKRTKKVNTRTTCLDIDEWRMLKIALEAI